MQPHLSPAAPNAAPLGAIAGRYELSFTLNGVNETQHYSDFDHAHAALITFRIQHADNDQALAGIWDRGTLRTVANWRGGVRKPVRRVTVADIFAGLIARGEPVTVIGRDEVAHYNCGGEA